MGASGRDRRRRPAGEAAEFKRLKWENTELRRASESLKAAAGLFAAELHRPHKY